MPCTLKAYPIQTIPGLTLFSEPDNACLKPTAVYLPPKYMETKKKVLNVVLWLHGFYVKNHKFLFFNDAARVREQVLRSGKDVVLVAPFLGDEEVDKEGNFYGDYSVKDLGGGKWGERYLDGVLEALAKSQKPPFPPAFDVKNLVIACHSGGGAGMRKLVGTLGKYRSKLQECWGFDCLYGAKAEPDDATFWYQFVSGKEGRPLYVVYGRSTAPQSVKLYLMGKGKANARGNRLDPPGPPSKNLHVTIGHYLTVPYMGQNVSVNITDDEIDKLISQPPATAKQPPKAAKPQDGDFVKQAVSNLRGNHIFMDEIKGFELHYYIAREFFLLRLRNSTFF